MKKLWQTQMPVQVEAVAWDLLVQSLEHYRQEEKADDCGWEVPDFLVVELCEPPTGNKKQKNVKPSSGERKT